MNLKVASQEDVEKAMTDLGYQRYDASVLDSSPSTTPHGQALLRDNVENVLTAVKEWATKRKGNPSAKMMKQAGLDVASFLACRVTLDKCTEGDATERTLARMIGNAVEEEALLKRFRAEFAAEWKTLLRHTTRNNVGAGIKRRIFRTAANKARGTWEPWARADKIRIGILLLDFIITETGVVRREVIKKKYKGKVLSEALIKVAPEALVWLEDAHQRFAMALPTYLPCVEPPLDWTTNFDGGYHGFSSNRGGLIRHQPLLRHLSQHISMSECPLVLRAVNAAQSTAWEVNEDVRQTAAYFWGLGSPVAGLPPRENYLLPAVPPDIDENPESKKEWKREAAYIYSKNAELTGKRVRTSRIITTSETFADRPIYFPQKLCFRTRMYPVPGYLEPQGDDLGKAHLSFARAKPRDEGWLSIHGSGLYGDDKGSVEERKAWASERRQEILRVYEDPLENRWWTEADKPWQFLQFCLDYGRSDGLSAIPCTMDGSNNGLQVLSLINRDVEGAIATNVVWSGKREDIYQRVADRATRKLRALVPTEEWALAWDKYLGPGGLTRKATKRPVMTTPYGVKLPTARDYFREWHREQPGWVYEPDAITTRSIFNVADLIWDSIREEVPRAIEIMEWLQRVASKACDLGKPILWTTPLGVRVGQLYRNPRKEQIRTTLRDGLRRRSTVYQDGEKPNRMKMKDGIAPNVVHSLDASAMFLTTTKAQDQGVTHFSMVHDSFGTHSHDCDILARCTREAYYEILKGNVLLDFKRQQEENLGVTLPHPPEQGDLDPREVLNSPHFFL